jgi:hypothetical protein
MKPDKMSVHEARTACLAIGAEVKAEMAAKGIGDPDVVDAEVHRRWEIKCHKKYPRGLESLAPKRSDKPHVPVVAKRSDKPHVPVVAKRSDKPHVPVVAVDDIEEDIEPSIEELGMPTVET